MAGRRPLMRHATAPAPMPHQGGMPGYPGSPYRPGFVQHAPRPSPQQYQAQPRHHHLQQQQRRSTVQEAPNVTPAANNEPVTGTDTVDSDVESLSPMGPPPMSQAEILNEQRRLARAAQQALRYDPVQAAVQRKQFEQLDETVNAVPAQHQTNGVKMAQVGGIMRPVNVGLSGREFTPGVASKADAASLFGIKDAQERAKSRAKEYSRSHPSPPSAATTPSPPAHTAGLERVKSAGSPGHVPSRSSHLRTSPSGPTQPRRTRWRKKEPHWLLSDPCHSGTLPAYTTRTEGPSPNISFVNADDTIKPAKSPGRVNALKRQSSAKQKPATPPLVGRHSDAARYPVNTQTDTTDTATSATAATQSPLKAKAELGNRRAKIRARQVAKTQQAERERAEAEHAAALERRRRAREEATAISRQGAQQRAQAQAQRKAAARRQQPRKQQQQQRQALARGKKLTAVQRARLRDRKAKHNEAKAKEALLNRRKWAERVGIDYCRQTIKKGHNGSSPDRTLHDASFADKTAVREFEAEDVKHAFPDYAPVSKGHATEDETAIRTMLINKQIRDNADRSLSEIARSRRPEENPQQVLVERRKWAAQVANERLRASARAKAEERERDPGDSESEWEEYSVYTDTSSMTERAEITGAQVTAPPPPAQVAQPLFTRIPLHNAVVELSPTASPRSARFRPRPAIVPFDEGTATAAELQARAADALEDILDMASACARLDQFMASTLTPAQVAAH